MSVILPCAIFVSWFAFLLAPAGRLAIEDEQRNVPKEKRRGVSIFPGIPVLPLVAWGAAVSVDHFLPPWGSRIFLGIHSALLVISLSVIARDTVRLRRIKHE